MMKMWTRIVKHHAGRLLLTLMCCLLLLAGAQFVFAHGTSSDGDQMPDDWEAEHGLNTNVDDSLGDPDGDNLINYYEYIADTDPQDPDSHPQLQISDYTNIVFGTTSSNRVYHVEVIDNLVTGSWSALTAKTPGGNLVSIPITNETTPALFYRLRVGFPDLFATPGALDFGPVALGQTSAVRTIFLTNEDSTNHMLMMIMNMGENPSEFVLSSLPASNYVLAPQQTVPFEVAFAPTSASLRSAQLKCHFDNHANHVYVNLAGSGEYHYYVNAGGTSYTDSEGNFWQADTGYFNVGNVYSAGVAIAGTEMDPLYQDERWDDTNTVDEMVFSFPVEPGPYVVRLHFAEVFSSHNAVGSRLFDVQLEGTNALVNYDIFQRAGFESAIVEELFTQVDDTSLDITFVHKVDNPKISAFEIFSGQVVADSGKLAWGHVAIGASGTVEQVVLKNTGSQAVTIDTIAFLLQAGAAHDFTVTIDGVDYSGGDVDTEIAVSIVLAAGEQKTITIAYEPTEEVDNDVWLRLSGDFPSVNISLQGTGGDGTGHPFLHTVINAPTLAVDYDGNGMEDVVLDGSDSHTHEFGHSLLAYEWTTNSTVIATNLIATNSFVLGLHDISLTIFDDNVPAETLSADATLQVVSASNVPGPIHFFYEGVAGGGERDPVSMMTAVPLNADYAVRGTQMLVEAHGSAIGQTPYSDQVLIRVVAKLSIENMDSYEFDISGGVTNMLLIDNTLYTSSVMLHVGMHDVETRFAVASTADLPAQVRYGRTGETTSAIPMNLLFHDESGLLPVVNTAPTEGLNLGGNTIEIEGFGFFPPDQVVVHWGGANLTSNDIVVTPEKITLVTPASNGVITVTVETPNGVSDSFDYNYTADGPVPVVFNLSDAATVIAPTQGEWGPDGRLYVASVVGTITALSFDDNYQVTNTQVITTLQGESNNNILGIGINPFDDSSTVRVYVAHSQLFANGGECFSGFSPYSGSISVLSGPNFDTIDTIIDGLPVSNHDHGINGLQFDNQGRLLIALGGNSNAGVTNCNMGGLFESPLSAAILRADISKPDFNGHVTYVETGTSITNMDQSYGSIVDVASSVDVQVFAPGFRNPFDLVFTTSGHVYATDNGPNTGYGGASTSATTEDPDPNQNDMLNLVLEGNYYGHPNRNRGRYDSRQYVYHDNSEASIPGEFSQGMATFQPSVNGIDEYRAETFKGALRGELIMQKWNDKTYRIELSEDGRNISAALLLPTALNSLDVISGPGGALLGVSYSDNKVVVAQPDDVTATGVVMFDIFPWRAPASGGQRFVIGGVGFGTLGNTTVQIGSSNAVLTYVSSNRIHGVIPAAGVATNAFLDVTVTSGGQPSTVSNAFRYLLPAGTGYGRWETLPNMPLDLGEVSAGVIDGVLYAVGEGHAATLAFDLFKGAWLPNREPRTIESNHHAAEVIDGKLYLFGGLNNDIDLVQIYDPVTDSWSQGTPMPWPGGSCASALIDGKVYLAGGISGDYTVNSNAVYDPQADSWTMLAPMPVGRNHPASSTDGEKFYVFGGRGPGSGGSNVVAEGFDDVMIYTPATDSWESSSDGGSTIPPLPQKRGAMGKAAWFDGEFYVMGGETTSAGTGQVTGDVYDRVDVYDPVAQTWRLDSRMVVPRHGIFPVVYDDGIYLPGGGLVAGGSGSVTFDVLKR